MTRAKLAASPLLQGLALQSLLMLFRQVGDFSDIRLGLTVCVRIGVLALVSPSLHLASALPAPCWLSVLALSSSFALPASFAREGEEVRR